MAKLQEVITTYELGPIICKALGLDPERVCRVILDVNIAAPDLVKVYVELVADERVMSVDWSALKGLQIERGDKWRGCRGG